MYHLRLKGNHYQIGVKRGTIFLKNGVIFPLHLDDFQIEHGKQSEKILKMFFPEVCEEVKGVSDTIGVDYFYFISWLLCMGCCMYNLENNIEIRGCTAFAYCKEGNVIYGRNNDLPPYLKKGSKSEIYSPENGNQFQITTSSFINGEEGLNEHGLAVAMTFVMTNIEQIRAGFNACFIVRYLLEKANDTEQALALLMDLPIASNCNILIADKNANMVVVECSPSMKKIRKPETLKCASVVCAVNRFISKEMQVFECPTDDYDAQKRYQVVMESFDSHMQDDLIENTKRLLKGEYGFMCQYDKALQFETVWSSIFDLKSLIVYRAEGDPRKKKFIQDNRLCDSKIIN